MTRPRAVVCAGARPLHAVVGHDPLLCGQGECLHEARPVVQDLSDSEQVAFAYR